MYELNATLIDVVKFLAIGYKTANWLLNPNTIPFNY